MAFTDRWKKKLVTAEKVLEKIRPGMSIFLGTGAAEPRSLVKSLLASEAGNLQDLEMVQLVSLGDAVSIEEKYAHKYRLKTFFAGWIASEAINKPMLKVFEKAPFPIKAEMKSGVYALTIPFHEQWSPGRPQSLQ